MANKDLLYGQRLQVSQEYDSGEHTVTSICTKHGYSRTWFCKFREHREGLGREGPRSKVRKAPQMPNQVPLDYVKPFPTHGPQRTANELATERYGSTKVGHTRLYGVLKRRSPDTRKGRLAWIQRLSGAVVHVSQFHRGEQVSKRRRIEASYPGELVRVVAFYVGCPQGAGRIYQQAACDRFSSFGWARPCRDKTVDSANDF